MAAGAYLMKGAGTAIAIHDVWSAKGGIVSASREAAALVLDNATGEILAYVGSANFFDVGHQGANDGVLAHRLFQFTHEGLLEAFKSRRVDRTEPHPNLIG